MATGAWGCSHSRAGRTSVGVIARGPLAEVRRMLWMRAGPAGLAMGEGGARAMLAMGEGRAGPELIRRGNMEQALLVGIGWWRWALHVRWWWWWHRQTRRRGRETRARGTSRAIARVRAIGGTQGVSCLT